MSEWTNIHRRAEYRDWLLSENESLGAFLSLNLDQPEGAAGPLEGIPVAVKDNIAVANQPLTCASRILSNLVAPYDATVVARLKRAGAVIIGKTNLDEFGMGSSNQDSALGQTYNPWNRDRVPGGSSGGSAVAVAAGMVPLAVGTDTGGSIRQPAMFCGVYGYKPTYGLLSRYGLTAYASSLEVPGFLSRRVDWLEKAFEVCAGPDPYDQTSNQGGPVPANEVKTLAVLKVSSGLSPAVERTYREHQKAWMDLGLRLVEVEIPALEYAVPVYYTIATAEASANLARFNGIRYGVRPDFAENPTELVRKARTRGFGLEVKRRILLGTYVLRSGFQDQYYHRAQRIRTLIRRDFEAVFFQAQALLLPVYPTQAFPRGEGGLSHFQQKLADKFTVGANLTGYPAIAIPAGIVDGLPVGFQLMAPPFQDRSLLAMARLWERNFPTPFPPDYPPRWED